MEEPKNSSQKVTIYGDLVQEVGKQNKLSFI